MINTKNEYNPIDRYLAELAEFEEKLEFLDFKEFTCRFTAMECELQNLIVHLKRAFNQAGNMLELAKQISSNALQEGFFAQVAKADYFMEAGQLSYINYHLLPMLYARIPDCYVAARILNPDYNQNIEEAISQLQEFLIQRMRPFKEYYEIIETAFGQKNMERFLADYGEPKMQILWIQKTGFLAGSIGACFADNKIFVAKADGTALILAKNGEFISTVKTPAKSPKGCYQGENGRILLPDSANATMIIVDGQGNKVNVLSMERFWGNAEHILLTSACECDGIIYVSFYDHTSFYSYIIELSGSLKPRLVLEKQDARFVISSHLGGPCLLDTSSGEVGGLRGKRRYFKIDDSMLKSGATGLLTTRDLFLISSARGALACSPNGRVYYHIDFIHLSGEYLSVDFMFPVCEQENLFGFYSCDKTKLALLRIPIWEA